MVGTWSIWLLRGKEREALLKEASGLKSTQLSDDPYETPVNPEITLTTTDCTAAEAARKIISYLEDRGNLVAEA